MQQNDEQAKWVIAAQAGDRQAFDRLVELYQRRALAVASRLLGNIDEAMDVSQEALIRAYKALNQLSDHRKFGPWLMRIVTTQALNYRRKTRKHRHLSLTDFASGNDESDKHGLDEQLASDEPTALENLAATELARQLKQAIDELPENLRTALILYSVEKMPQKEIADIMKCTLQSVKWNVFEARRRLKKRLL
ncbi:MAG: sigma-70 family RNA polymerase sigma factor [Planctomycetes bacterium]|nr:sigma-70 family RNA polymerase sigma factor [Planctomycetota bacterium]